MDKDARLKQAVAVVLRRLREEHKFSQEKLAAEADLSRSTIDKIERRERLPSLSVILSIARAYKINASDIVKELEKELA